MEISDCLFKIADKLYKAHILSKESFNEFINNRDSYTFDELSRWACIFLDVTINNPRLFLKLKDEFNKLYEYFLITCSKPNSNANSIRILQSIENYLINSGHEVYIDGNFSRLSVNKLFLNNLRVLIPNDGLKHKILEMIYGLGAEIYDRESGDTLLSDAEAVINGDMIIEFYLYDKLENGNIRFRRLTKNNEIELTQIDSTVLRKGYKFKGNKAKIETDELLYINSIVNGSAVDYIVAYQLILSQSKKYPFVSKIDKYKKSINELRNRISIEIVSVKEDKKDGLQETSGIAIS